MPHLQAILAPDVFPSGPGGDNERASRSGYWQEIAVVVIPQSSRCGCATCLAQGRNRRRISNGSIELASIDNAVIVPLKYGPQTSVAASYSMNVADL